jgi:hypothetical protein
MKSEQIIEKIHKAYNTLLAQDIYLLQNDANERSLTHKLAGYLELEFPEWNVDCEYNKNLGDAKKVDAWELKRKKLLSKLGGKLSTRERSAIEKILEGGVSVYPDIIIHHRGTNENFIVIEAKKNGYPGDDYDKEKLECYIAEFNYDYTFKVTFPSIQDLNSKIDLEKLIVPILPNASN